MHRLPIGCFFIGVGLLVSHLGCGARSALPDERSRGAGGSGGAGGAASSARSASSASSASSTGAGGSGGCEDGAVEACGSDVGACAPGQRTCNDGAFGPCEGAIGPTPEKCDGIDNNCNGVIDADCEIGTCASTLLVIGSTPSLPTCIDFPVEAGSMGTIDFPCGGGVVSANLGTIAFSGAVKAGVLALDGTVTLTGPDGCVWLTSHHIEGVFASGELTYSYKEASMPKPGQSCWQPCTEVGKITIKWK